MFFDLIPARNAQIDAALADKGGNIGGGEEYEGNGKVLDESDVETVLSSELDVGTF
jgi:hypothetical protein